MQSLRTKLNAKVERQRAELVALPLGSPRSRVGRLASSFFSKQSISTAPDAAGPAGCIDLVRHSNCRASSLCTMVRDAKLASGDRRLCVHPKIKEAAVAAAGEPLVLVGGAEFFAPFQADSS
jgi:hypothetical protein